MSLNFDVVGVDSEPAMTTWGQADVLLCAPGVGAGADDPLAELEFTTEQASRFTSMEGRFTAGDPRRRAHRLHLGRREHRLLPHHR